MYFGFSFLEGKYGEGIDSVNVYNKEVDVRIEFNQAAFSHNVKEEDIRFALTTHDMTVALMKMKVIISILL